jgi:hypothetical protein
MTEEQAPHSWVGRAVVLSTLGRQQVYEDVKHGQLEQVSSEGIALLQWESVSWGEPSAYGERGREDRFVSMFYPWRSVYSIREQEEEEKRDFQKSLRDSLR